MLSLDRFHLKQTPVLNFNCRDSLGFPSYFAQKDFLFCSVCIFKCCVTFLFCCPSGLALHFQMFASFFFSLPKWLALHFQNVCIIFLEFWLEGLGARLGILWDPSRLGSFGGSLFFLGLWEHPKFRGSLFFGDDPRVNFSKSRPC